MRLSQAPFEALLGLRPLLAAPLRLALGLARLCNPKLPLNMAWQGMPPLWLRRPLLAPKDHLPHVSALQGAAHHL